MEYSKELHAQTTDIPGVIVFDLPVYGDNRGWFKENWQREKMTALGLPDIKMVQNNISFNSNRGATRGIHAEPWDKFISVATGAVFGAWVDLREGPTFGKTFTITLDPSKAIFIPRGVGNSYQALEDGTAYTYLVNAHWSADLQEQYTFLNLADETANIQWPIPLDSAEVELSDKDKAHPRLADVVPMKSKTTLVIGANGQVGSAVRQFADTHGRTNTFHFVDVNDPSGFDFTDESTYANIDWSQYGTIINAAAYTAVDDAETSNGRKVAWKLNAIAPSLLAKTAIEHNITLVHISSEYVFDGDLCDHPFDDCHQSDCQHTEDEPLSPLGVYAQSKAAGDVAVTTVPKHYLVRTSWVVGDGKNFVKTMEALAQKGVKPQVVNDQFGRLTFTSTLVEGIFHLLDTEQTFGTYNLTNSGRVVSWYEVAQEVFALTGHTAQDVAPISTDEYTAKNSVSSKPISPRPANSIMNISKIEATGYTSPDWSDLLREYLK